MLRNITKHYNCCLHKLNVFSLFHRIFTKFTTEGTVLLTNIKLYKKIYQYFLILKLSRVGNYTLRDSNKFKVFQWPENSFF